jgi:hypothetical protein
VIYEDEDADAVCAELAKRGVGLLNAPMDRNGECALPVFTTPDGHIWEVVIRDARKTRRKRAVA